MPTKSTRTEQMKKIRDELLELEESPLYEYRTKNGYYPVVGEGSHSADIMFIGEAPGKNEAETARPFCGRAGKILDDLLEHIELDRGDVYITNILKDRPPNNRDPSQEEIEIYTPFLDRQIQIIEPEAIVTLGRYAMEYIMPKFGLEFEMEKISQAHGSVYDSSTELGDIKIIPLYHPAVATYNPNKIDILKEDMEIVKSVV